jgi:hypothetical protein
LWASLIAIPGYPCILHYLELGDTKWRKCPVCADSIHAKDLKSVKWFNNATAFEDGAGATPVGTGDYLTMRLVERPQITTLALPRSATWPSDAIPPHAAPWHFAPDVSTFAKFMLASPEYMVEELDGDLAELRRELVSSVHDDLGAMFVQKSMAKINEQKEKALLLKTPSVVTARKQAMRDLAKLQERITGRRPSASVAPPTESDEPETDDATSYFLATSSHMPEVFRASSASRQLADPQPTPPAPQPPKLPRPRRNLNPPPPSTTTFYFYQAASGQPIFLHPLDIRILKSHFEHYSAFPDTIRVRVEAADEGSMNDELRRRCKYLGHLPQACDVTFIEADLSDVLGPEDLAPYAQPLRQRRNKRKEEVKKDERAKTRAEAKEREERERATRELVPGVAAASARPALSSLSSPERPVSAPLPPSEPVGPPPQPQRPSVESGPRTVWGTRAVSFAATQQEQQPSVYEDDFDAVWHDWESGVLDGGVVSAGRGGGGGASRKSKGNNRAAASGEGGGGNGNGNGDTDGPATGSGGGGGKRSKQRKLVLSLTSAGPGGRR